VAAAVAIGLALVVIGGIGVLLSRLIKAGVSRQRELLADASAVQFTREPEGLAGALKKIAGHSARIVSVDTEEVAHMLFERGTSRFSGWFATHPPLLERIRTLEPTFDPADLPPPQPLARTSLTDAGYGASAGLAAAAAAAVSAGSPLERAGEIAAPAGAALRAAVPDELYHATRSRDSSLLVVLALALSNDEPTRRQQLALLERQLGATRAELTARLFADLARSSAELRLPMLELALPTLRERPREQLAYLSELLVRVKELDKAERLFDFVLLRVLKTYLRDSPGAVPPAPRAARKLDSRSAVRLLLANVAAYGSADAAAANRAYAAGLESLRWRAVSGDPTFDPPAAARDLEGLDAALTALTAIRPRDQERVLRGVLATIRADAVTGVEERELFRVIASVLDCPLPPDVTL
jgi:hypothetical protein